MSLALATRRYRERVLKAIAAASRTIALLSMASIAIALMGGANTSDVVAAEPDRPIKKGQESTASEPAARAPRPAFPRHWGVPPAIQTRDYVPLPGAYGSGSSTLAKWIQQQLDQDAANGDQHAANGDHDAANGPGPETASGLEKGPSPVTISGELKQWHKVTLTFEGPFAREQDDAPNPFVDYALSATFRHESGAPSYTVPGYFAADGDAANSGASSGTKWRIHLSPDKPGRWTYDLKLMSGPGVAVSETVPGKVETVARQQGEFEIDRTDKRGPDFRAKGRLEYVGRHYLQFQGSKEYFLKFGPDAPETLLAFADFDNTRALKKNVPLKTWQPHLRDWMPGDPTWKNGRGKGLIGALNYLAHKGCNTVSFLTYNAGGDGDNVWPFVERNDKRHYDCSKLDQWQILFDHASARGLHLHFKLQENELDDNRTGAKGNLASVPESLDGGLLGPERKLYCRELIARFGYELALLWNIGEENTQSTREQCDMARYLQQTDPYRRNIVVHTFPDQQDRIYSALLQEPNAFTGASLQNRWNDAHRRTLQWVSASAQAGRPWVVCNDEQNPASDGVPPDPGYAGSDGWATQNGKKYSLDDIRKECLWGTLMAGGAGVEYYFGYKLPQNDLLCEDFRSRDRSWDYGRIALEFFQRNQIPFHEMRNVDHLVGNPTHKSNVSRDSSASPNSNAAPNKPRYGFGQTDRLYLVYLPQGGTTTLDLTSATGEFDVLWFDTRNGGDLRQGSVVKANGGREVSLGLPPSDTGADWLIVVRR